MPKFNRLILASALTLAACATPAPPVATHAAGYGPGARSLPPAAPGETGLSAASVDALVDAAAKANTGGLTLIHRGRSIVNRELGAPDKLFKLNSITKAFAWMAIGLLIEEGQIESVDTPVSTWFPAWKTGLKAQVTLRHLLTHTSGMRGAAEQPGEGSTFFSEPDSVAQAANLPVIKQPGRHHAYSNAAYQILSGVVGRASGKSLEAYMAERIFRPLGITRWTWSNDRAGNSNGYAGLSLTSLDLAKVGWLIANGGRWHDAQLVSARWIAMSTRPDTPAHPLQGRCWFLRWGRWITLTPESLERLERAGLATAAKLAPLVGRRFDRRNGEFFRAAAERLDPAEYEVLEAHHMTALVPVDAAGFQHSGAGGQYLLIDPETKLVLVRTVDAYDPKTGESPWMFWGIDGHFDRLIEDARAGVST